MNYAIDFAGVAGAIFLSFAVALGLEWVSLVLMMRLMPARPVAQTVAQRLSTTPEQRTNRTLDQRAA